MPRFGTPQGLSQGKRNFVLGARSRSWSVIQQKLGEHARSVATLLCPDADLGGVRIARVIINDLPPMVARTVEISDPGVWPQYRAPGDPQLAGESYEPPPSGLAPGTYGCRPGGRDVAVPAARRLVSSAAGGRQGP